MSEYKECPECNNSSLHLRLDGSQYCDECSWNRFEYEIHLQESLEDIIGIIETHIKGSSAIFEKGIRTGQKKFKIGPIICDLNSETYSHPEERIPKMLAEKIRVNKKNEIDMQPLFSSIKYDEGNFNIVLNPLVPNMFWQTKGKQ